MKKLIVLLLVLSITLSGCVSNTKNDNNKTNDNKDDGGDSDTVEKANTGIMGKQPGINDNNIRDNINKLSASTDPVSRDTDKSGEISTETEWCKTGSKITIPAVKTQEQFTVKGITTQDGVEVCEAEIIRENGKSTVFFSKDNKYISMISTSSSTGSSSKATAISEISVGQ